MIGGGDRISGDRVAELSALLEKCSRQGQPRIVLDLRGVAIFDSAGLELLVDAQQQVQHKGGAIKLANPGGLCSDVLKLTGVGAKFEIFEDTGSAVRSFLA